MSETFDFFRPMDPFFAARRRRRKTVAKEEEKLGGERSKRTRGGRRLSHDHKKSSRDHRMREDNPSQASATTPTPPSSSSSSSLSHSHNNTSNPHLLNYFHFYQDRTKEVLSSYLSRGNHTYHTTGSLQKLGQYYSSSLLDKVTPWLLPDLLEFHYPVWRSAMSAKEYLYSLFIEKPLEILEKAPLSL